MKRQFLTTKSGFTLFELMIVITIFSVFIMATNVFNWTPQTDMEKSDRMMIAISSILRTEIQNISIGKMPKRDGKTALLTQITVGSGGLIMTYSGTTGVIGSGTFISPFFDNDSKYLIKNVTWTGSSTNPYGKNGTGEILITTDGLSFSGEGIYGSGYTLLEVKVGYGGMMRKVTLDRRTGKITESKK